MIYRALSLAVLALVAVQSATAQPTSPKFSKIDVGPPPITTEQRERLAEKLGLIGQIVRSVEGELASTDPSANTRKWLLESLLPLSLEQVRSIGMPGTLAQTTSAIAHTRNRVDLKALGNLSADLVYTP